MNIRTEYRFGTLADIATYLRQRSAEIKTITKHRKIDQARIMSRALAFEEIAELIDDSTIAEK